MYRQPVIDRSCGSCSLCCSVYEIHSISKPEWVWCEQCEQGGGCRIYATRPRVCRVFVCLWRTGSGEAADRPDLIGSMMDMRRLNDLGRTLLVNESHGIYSHSAAVRERMAACMKERMSIWVRRRDRRDILYIPSSIDMTDSLAREIVASEMRVVIYQ